MFYTICLILVIIPMLIIFPVKVIGKKNIPRKGKFIFCCNHQSNNDVLILGSRIIKRRFKFMAKESLFKNKFIGCILKGLGAYPVKRDGADISAIKKTLSFLKEDKAVCIFPEGKRLKTDEQNELKNGVIVFALKAKALIIPACIVRFPKPFRKNKLVIGEAINLSEMEEFKDKKVDDELIAHGREILHDKMFQLLKDNEKF